MSNKDPSRRPQFIRVLPTDFMEKMLIPATFVKHYIPKENLHNDMAVVFGPHGKIWQIMLKINQPDMFFAGGWSQFLAFHGITDSDSLLIRYEGNMVFTVKVFGSNGCQRSKHKQIGSQQSIEEQYKASSPCVWENDGPSSEGQEKTKYPVTSSKKASLLIMPVYEIGPHSWIQKQINTNTPQNHLALAKAFCGAIGLQEPCTVTLKTSMGSTKYWQLHSLAHNSSSYLLMSDWKRFCHENMLKKGDFCTFNVIESMLWHVIITRLSTSTDI